MTTKLPLPLTMREIRESYLKAFPAEVRVQSLIKAMDDCTMILKNLDTELVTEEKFITLNDLVDKVRQELELYIVWPGDE